MLHTFALFIPFGGCCCWTFDVDFVVDVGIVVVVVDVAVVKAKPREERDDRDMDKLVGKTFLCMLFISGNLD
jgi:hypothetical protein